MRTKPYAACQHFYLVFLNAPPGSQELFLTCEFHMGGKEKPNRRCNELHVFCFSITCWFQWEFANSWKSWGGVGQEVPTCPFCFGIWRFGMLWCFSGMVHNLNTLVKKTRAERAIRKKLVKSLNFTVMF